MKQDSNHEAAFVVVAYNKKEGKIQQFHMTANGYIEIFTDHAEIGSGADGANFYFLTKLQGVDRKKLKNADLAFFATNAYSLSTVNQGVGGTPNMTHITDEGTEMIDSDRTRVLANLSGAYLAEFPVPVLTNQRTRCYFDEVLNHDPRYDIIADVVSLNEATLKTILIPYSAWQERANTRLFEGRAVNVPFTK
jgi:hypothetical protein